VSREHGFAPVHLGCSTADAERPELRYAADELTVRFRDWREQWVELRFTGVVAFQWNDGEVALAPGDRDDGTDHARDSPWLRSHAAAGTVATGEGHGHYKLGFNAVGVLEVLAIGVTTND
jgi:hypothetical protein